MWYLVIFLFVTQFQLILNHSVRIVGGKDANIRDYPHQVSIRLFGGHFCGGSLISNIYVVTAAHCIEFDASAYIVQLGSSRLDSPGTSRSIKSIALHPNYNKPKENNDIAILELAEPVEFSELIRPINLPNSADILKDGSTVTITGFGDLFEGSGAGSNILQVVNVTKISNIECQNRYPKEIITENMMCAGVDGGGKDACQNDSGGPLIAQSILYGIISWGYGCGQPQYPGVYTYVPNVRDFIKNVTGI